MERMIRILIDGAMVTAAIAAAPGALAADIAGGKRVALADAPIAAAQPVLDLDFQGGIYKTNSQIRAFDDLITFSRGSTATYWDAAGVMRTAASGEPRFDHDPETGASLGLLIEESRTNLLLRSEAFDNASWTKTGATITANAVAAPDGATTADKLVEASAASVPRYVRQTVSGTLDNVTVAASVFFKAAERDEIRLIVFDADASSNFISCYFDAVTGAASPTVGGSGVAGSASLLECGEGWFLATLTGKPNGAGAGGGVQLDVRLAEGGASTYNGDGSSGLYIWGAQLEAGAFATPYIPTATAAVTRNADSASIVGSNFSDWFNFSEGTIFVEALTLPGLVGANSIAAFSFDDGATGNVMFFSRNASRQMRWNSRAGGVVDVDLTTTETISDSTSYRAAVAFKANSFAFCLNGAPPLVDTSNAVPNVNRMLLGQSIFAPAVGGGHIKRLRFYDRRLSDGELQAITA